MEPERSAHYRVTTLSRLDRIRQGMAATQARVERAIAESLTALGETARVLQGARAPWPTNSTLTCKAL